MWGHKRSREMNFVCGWRAALAMGDHDAPRYFFGAVGSCDGGRRPDLVEAAATGEAAASHSAEALVKPNAFVPAFSAPAFSGFTIVGPPFGPPNRPLPPTEARATAAVGIARFGPGTG